MEAIGARSGGGLGVGWSGRVVASRALVGGVGAWGAQRPSACSGTRARGGRGRKDRRRRGRARVVAWPRRSRPAAAQQGLQMALAPDEGQGPPRDFVLRVRRVRQGGTRDHRRPGAGWLAGASPGCGQSRGAGHTTPHRRIRAGDSPLSISRRSLAPCARGCCGRTDAAARHTGFCGAFWG